MVVEESRQGLSLTAGRHSRDDYRNVENFSAHTRTQEMTGRGSYYDDVEECVTSTAPW